MENQHHLYINKAINYIIENLTQPPDLNEVAKISGFSKFHFHRLFKNFTGETLNQFTRRIRLERAAFILLFDKQRSITDVALSCGFSNSQNFATAFKKYFHMTPKAYKTNRGCQGIIIHDPEVVAKYDIQLIFIDHFTFAYERNFGPYYSKHFDAQRTEMLSRFPDKRYIGLFLDDPTITHAANCRYDHGYVLESTTPPHNLSTQTLDAHTYIALTLDPDDETNKIEIWNYLYNNWLPRHGYIPAALFCFETRYQNHLTLHIPVKKI